MARIVKCEVCGAPVPESRIERHRDRKHPEKATGAPADASPRARRSLPITAARLVVLMLILITGGVLAYLYLAPAEYGPHGPVTQECVQHGSAGTFHIHPTLTITVNGSRVTVPDGIGLSPCMRPLHTHDDSGVIHVEYQRPSHFTLGEFFDVWGQPFDSTQVLGYKATGTSKLTMAVNGSPSLAFRALVLENGQRIDVVLA